MKHRKVSLLRNVLGLRKRVIFSKRMRFGGGIPDPIFENVETNFV